MHPIEDTVKRQTYINQRNIGHIITRYWWEGNLLWGEVETANTEAGRDFQGLIRQGCEVSFSMRGLGGDVKKRNGYEYIDCGLFIVCYDNVTIPSHAPAYIQEMIREEAEYKCLTESMILNESGDLFNVNGKITPVSESEMSILKDPIKSKTLLTDNARLMSETIDSYFTSL